MLYGKRVLVTGSSQGIGLAAGIAMQRAGARVMFHSEKPLDRCPELADILARPDTDYLSADLLVDGEPERLVATTWDRFGGLDVLVNNAGTFAEPALGSLKRSHFDRIFHLNVWSAMAAVQEFASRSIRGGTKGRVLFTTSLNARRSEPAHTLYDSAKGAVDAMVRQFAVELAPHGITTAAIAPGLVETPLTDMGLRSDPTARRTIEQQIPVGRIATADELAPWYVFLASDAATYATGTIITVDGGLDAQQMPSRPITDFERRP